MVSQKSTKRNACD